MAVQVSYPGVYIDEFTPAAPIEGVSTSVTALIGIAERGPIGEPRLVTSLDEFTATFGGPKAGATPYYLPLAAEGFFRNGGSQCVVLRVGTATPATLALTARTGGATLGTVVALRDGAVGDGGTVTVSDASTLTAALTAAGEAGPGLALLRSTSAITAIDATRRSVTVDDGIAGFAEGDRVVLTKDAETATVTVAGTTPAAPAGATTPGTVRFTGAVPGAEDFAAGSVATADPAVGTTVLRLDVPAALSLRAGISAGAVVSIADGTRTEWHTVADVGADRVTLGEPLAGTFDLSAPAVLTSAEFDLAITGPDRRTTTYPALSTGPLHPRWWGAALTGDPYARLVLAQAYPADDPRPAAVTDAPVTGPSNDDAAAAWTSVTGEINRHLDLLAPWDEISLVAVPGVTDRAAQQAIVEHCERLFNRFAILDCPHGVDPRTATQHRSALTGALNKGFGAFYYPWITIKDPARRIEVPQPPSGHLAGIFARTDATRGVHKAPANVGIAGAVGLERRITDADQGVLNPQGVNALRVLPGRGSPMVWGARTTADDTNWRYVSTRRLFLFLELSIQRALRLSLFEPNDLGLWQRLRRSITEFLTRAWRDGALFGETAKDAFYVRIDETLNPPSTRALGRLYIEVGVQPTYPAEFIVVSIGIWDGGASVSEA